MASCCRARYPIYLDSSVNRNYGIYGPVPKQTMLAAIDEHPDARR